MKTNNRLTEQVSVITESSKIVLLVMNTITTPVANSDSEDLAFAQRVATGNLTEADKAKQAELNKPAEPSQEEKDLAAKAEQDKAAADEAARIAAETANVTLDKDGNEVDKDGKIVKTKEEIANEAPPELSLVEELYVKSGLELLDEQGNKKVYEDSVEGTFKFVNDAAEHKAEAQINEFFETNPDIKEFASFILNGGKKEDYFKPVQKVSNVDISDEAGKEAAVLASLKLKGFDDKRAKEFVKLFVDSNKLDEEAKLAEKDLKEYDIKVEKEEKARIEAETLKRRTDTENHWKAIESIVSKGQLTNYTIPEADRKGFFDFIARNVDGKGNTQMDLKKRGLPLEQHIEIDYLIYKNFDFSKLVKSEMNKQTVSNLRSKIGKNTVSAGNENKNEGAAPTIDTSKMSMEEVHKFYNAQKEKQK